MAESGARLLVVDDNKVNRLLLIRALELQGHSAVGAENGRLALEMIEREPFDLMLLEALVINTGVSAYYYLRVIRTMYSVPDGAPDSLQWPVDDRLPVFGVVVVALQAVLLVGVGQRRSSCSGSSSGSYRDPVNPGELANP